MREPPRNGISYCVFGICMPKSAERTSYTPLIFEYVRHAEHTRSRSCDAQLDVPVDGEDSDRFRPAQAHVLRDVADDAYPYKQPAVIDWPKLDPAALKRVTSLPIWDIAVQTEGRASIRVATYAGTVEDPQLREALRMNGGEEARHKLVLSKLVEAYGIELAPEPPYPAPADPLRAWMLTGYGECIDSFFAFGLFEAARQSGYFPGELVETFEPVIQEEARHILFFANWVAWYRRTLPWYRKPWCVAKTASVWFSLIRDRISLARGFDKSGASQRTRTFPPTWAIRLRVTSRHAR